MASNNVRFELCVSWTQRGQTHYHRLSCVADPLHDTERDSDASPPPCTGVVAIPYALVGCSAALFVPAIHSLTIFAVPASLSHAACHRDPARQRR